LEFVVEGGPGTRTPHYCTYPYRFGLRNAGSGIARFVSLYVGLSTNVGVLQVHQFDGSGNLNYPFGVLSDAREFAPYGMHFITGGNIVIYPGEKLMLCGMSCQMASMDAPMPGVRYKIFAEHMVPKEGEAQRP
jgi:hypothetical protein